MLSIQGDPGRDALKATSGDAKSTGVQTLFKTGSGFGIGANLGGIAGALAIIGALYIAWRLLRKET